MEGEDYIKTLKDPDIWFRQAFDQKMVADKILADVIMNKDFLRSLKKTSNLLKFSTLWGNALYHYGIGIENGLKGVIVKNQPELINFELVGDDIILHDIGGKASKNHDLYSLANRSGILDKNLHLFKNNFDRKLLENVLQHLTDNLRWAARYPLPQNPSKVFRMDHDVPHVCVYGFHILDVIEPLFEYFKTLQSPDNDAEVDFLEKFLRAIENKEEGL